MIGLCRPLSKILFVGFLLSLGCATSPESDPRVPDPSSLRRLSHGELLGHRMVNGGHAWRGIPFARPPVGKLRWRASQSPDSWTGTRMALQDGSPCVQLPRGFGEDGERISGTEDCLYLNVFAPAMSPGEVADLSKRLPVMVWIHGGGNTMGSGDVYDGSVLAQRGGVIVVSVNYRLGVLGWLSHPALRLDETNALDGSGNFGTLDLIRALEWVRDEIPKFGGDPERVTVFGESAGGGNIFSLLISPPARGLFQRAIIQSGFVATETLSRAENFSDAEIPGAKMSSRELLLALIERDGSALDRAAAQKYLASMSSAQVAHYLRDKTPEELLKPFESAAFGGMYFSPNLFRDGFVLPDAEPMALLQSGKYARVPVLLGTNRDEAKLFVMMGSENLRRLFRIPLWFKDERAYDLETHYPSLMWKAQGVDEPAQALASVDPGRTFAYRFDWDEEKTFIFADLAKMLGACHAIEIPFVFGDLSFLGLDRYLFDSSRLPAAEKLSRAMVSYWTEFAHVGDPGRGRDAELPSWSAWSDAAPDSPRTMILDTDEGGGLRMISETVTRSSVLEAVAADTRFEDEAERCEVYSGFTEFSQSLSPEEYAQLCAAFPLTAR